nr:ATP synthase F0 subunit 8 [Runcina aurata]
MPQMSPLNVVLFLMITFSILMLLYMSWYPLHKPYSFDKKNNKFTSLMKFFVDGSNMRSF